MPEVTDPNLLAQLNGGGGPIMGPPPKGPDPYQVAKDTRTETRSAEDQQMQRERFEWEKASKAAELAKGGKDFKPTEYQSKSAGFLGRMLQANTNFGTVPEDSRDPRSTVGQFFFETMPSIENNFNTNDRQSADQAARNFIAASLRQESGAAIGEQEYANQYRIFFPMPGDGPDVLEQKARDRAQAIEGFKIAAGPLAEQVLAPFATDPATEGDPNATPPGAVDTNPRGADKSTPLNELPGEVQDRNNLQLNGGEANGYTVENDTVLSGLKSEYAKRLAAGQSTGQIMKWLADSGVKINNPQFPASVNQQVQFRKKNPQVDISNYPLDSFDDVYVPRGAMLDGLNAAAQGEVAGVSPGTYAINAADAATGFNLDSLSANPELTRQGMNELAERNPGSALTGNITGGVLSSLAAEAMLPFRGAQGAMAGDALYGTIAGAGQTDYNSEGGQSSFADRVRGGGTGTLAALAGNLGGQAAVRGAQAVTAPTGGGLSGLYQAGVRPSVGQRVANSGDGKGFKGFVGSTINKVEEAAQSVYGVGDAIRGTRQNARDQFQIGAFNEALKEIDEVLPAGMKPGTAPQGFTQAAFNRTYDKARSGMNFVADADFITDVTAVSNTVSALTESSQKQFKTILDNTLTRRAKSGGMSGTDYKAAMSDLGKKIDSIRRNKNGDDELADALLDLQSTIDNAARRHSPPEFVELMDKADAGYAKLVRIEEASKRAGSDAGEFTPTQFQRAVQKGDSSVRSKAYLRGDALMQEYADQGMTLVDKLPNSGTSDRLIVTGGAGAASSFFTPLGAFLGALGIANAPGVRKLTTGAMAPAGPKRQAVSKAIGALGRPASVLGSTTSVGLIEP